MAASISSKPYLSPGKPRTATEIEIVNVADLDDFQRKVAAIHADCPYEFELPRAPDFAVDTRSAFAVGAVGWAVSG
jgi:hypothetical protein